MPENTFVLTLKLLASHSDGAANRQSLCRSMCGDGTINQRYDEECDDFNEVNHDGCSAVRRHLPHTEPRLLCLFISVV